MKVQFSGLSVLKVFVGTVFFCCFLTTFSLGQIKYDDCDKEACRAESKIAEANVKKICYTQPVNNAACIAAFQEWEKLIALNCPKKKETTNTEKYQPAKGNTKAKESPDKGCNSDVPPSPHDVNSFDRDFVENVIMPLIDSSAFGFVGLGKTLLISAQGYAENATRFRDEKTQVYKPVKGNDPWNLQYPYKPNDPNNRTVTECLDVPQNLYAGLKIDPNDPKTYPVDLKTNKPKYFKSKNKGFVCQYVTRVINSRNFDSLQAAAKEYMNFAKQKYSNGYYEAITDDDISIQTLIEKMAQAHGTEPNYKPRLINGAAQIMKALIDYCNMKLAVIDRNLTCLAASTNDQKPKDDMESQLKKYEAIKKAAENLRKILKPR